MNRRTLDLARLQAARDPYGPAATWLEEQAERRAEERTEPMSGPECDRVADFDAIKRGAA